MNRTPHKVPGGIYIRAEAGGVDLQAVAGDGKALRRFTMTAYTGGAMALAGWPYPVVVDLAGLALGKKSRPILMNHDTGRIVGHTDTVGTDGGSLTVAGVISVVRIALCSGDAVTVAADQAAAVADADAATATDAPAGGTGTAAGAWDTAEPCPATVKQVLNARYRPLPARANAPATPFRHAGTGFR